MLVSSTLQRVRHPVPSDESAAPFGTNGLANARDSRPGHGLDVLGGARHFVLGYRNNQLKLFSARQR